MITQIEPRLLTFNAVKFAADAYTYRMETGLNREDFGDMLGCAKGCVNSYETRVSIPKLELFYNLCLLMGKEVSEYFK
jgi:DNA-binding XRE family transcriptional regulator